MHALKLVLNHGRDLILKEKVLLLVECALFIVLNFEGAFGQFEEVFDDFEGVLQLRFQNIHLFFENDKLLFVGHVVVADLL